MTRLPPDSTLVADAPPRAVRSSDELLIHRFRAGDDSAATALFERYMPRVRSLAHARCPGAYAGRFDADDIVQSVFQAFFSGIRADSYCVPPDGQIWGLLMVLALNKIRSQVEFHQAAKRSVLRTQRPSDFDGQPGGFDSSEGLLQVVIDDLMSRLPETSREIVRLRLEGYEVKEIAVHTGTSLRTVERALQAFRGHFADSA